MGMVRRLRRPPLSVKPASNPQARMDRSRRNARSLVIAVRRFVFSPFCIARCVTNGNFPPLWMASSSACDASASTTTGDLLVHNRSSNSGTYREVTHAKKGPLYYLFFFDTSVQRVLSLIATQRYRQEKVGCASGFWRRRTRTQPRKDCCWRRTIVCPLAVNMLVGATTKRRSDINHRRRRPASCC